VHGGGGLDRCCAGCQRNHTGTCECKSLRDNWAYEGWIFAVITLEPALLDDTIERVNISLPRRVLRRLDAAARAAGESRSGFIAHLALGQGVAASK